ncbi:ADP-ribosylglycohydrolase family protein [Streptomyces sp. NBRC 109706]|uniref:ADP-ribosylglycohydrolase family protein n=1 Tax=Streptomyces sp. NBRC 109706 TaxID=1550035 RepID=UPI0007804646|nr:ADP-ribosylglycohydrolase family protein [Streptomyces sp. NBRC 109706]
MTDTTAAALASLRGLALGDAFGQTWFAVLRSADDPLPLIRSRTTPAAPRWPWTDDTALALALLRVAVPGGDFTSDELAREFGETYAADPGRGYASGMHTLLPELAREPASWRTRSSALFGGEGSLGNGAAMRAAPLGALLHRDLPRAVARAGRAARVTHTHPEAVAGAVAVTVAAALAATAGPAAGGPAWLRDIAAHTPPGAVRDGLARAAALPAKTPPAAAAEVLGNGVLMRADDTVPFALWSAARHPDSLTDALWTTAEGLGDIDTTCAITGGVVGARTGLDGVPAEWRARCEPLPEWVDALQARRRGD